MENTNAPKLLGILGGLGPMATVYFYEMLTAHTKADTDQEHIDIIISSRATTPDRTAYILGTSDASPIPALVEETKRLTDAGASLIVMPCNTAHYFYEELEKVCLVPMLNIVNETVRFCSERGMKRIGILATEGTIRSGTYSSVCEQYGIEAAIPSEASQGIINEIIYGQIKKGISPDVASFLKVCDGLGECDTFILGCTELSLLKKYGLPEGRFTDSLEVLAYSTIKSCKKTPVGFSFL
jgi:aspartate racemase